MKKKLIHARKSEVKVKMSSIYGKFTVKIIVTELTSLYSDDLTACQIGMWQI